MICIDGTFLTVRYKGQILTAIGVDCNNQIIPLAFAFVDNKNLDSWYWFLKRVKVHVVVARPDVCLISDSHAGLLQSILKLKRGTVTPVSLWTGGCHIRQLSRISRLSPQTNTSLFYALCPHSCAPEKDFPVGHPSPNCSGPSTLNLGVLWRSASPGPHDNSLGSLNCPHKPTLVFGDRLPLAHTTTL